VMIIGEMTKFVRGFHRVKNYSGSRWARLEFDLQMAWFTLHFFFPYLIFKS